MPSYTALYPYEPRAAGELLLLEGEVVTQVVPDTGDGWTKVSGKNGSGLVPSSYIQACVDHVAPPLPPPPPPAAGGQQQEVEALYDFTDPSSAENLDLALGERYTLLDGSAADWWQVKAMNGRVGFVPASYVKKVEARSRKDSSGAYGFPPSSSGITSPTAPSAPVTPVAPTAPGGGGFARSRGQQQSYRGISPTEKRRIEQQQREQNKGKVDQEAEVEIRAIAEETTALEQRLLEGAARMQTLQEKFKVLEKSKNANRQRFRMTDQHVPAQMLEIDTNRLRQIQQLLQ